MTLKKILIIMPRQLGDVLLTTTLPQAIHNENADVRIDWYAHPMSKQILEGNKHLTQIHYHPKNFAFFRKNARKGFLGFFSAMRSLFKEEINLVRRIKKENYDVVVDVMNNPRTALLSFLSQAKQRVSFKTRFLRNLAYTDLMTRDAFAGDYIAYTRLKLLRCIGIEEKNWRSLTAELPFSQEELANANDFVSGLKSRLPGKKLVLLSPTHRHPVRRWPHYAALAKALVDTGNVVVIWLFGPGEEQLVSELHRQVQIQTASAANGDLYSVVAPLFSLREVAALASLCDLFVGNSNGLSHVAVAGGIKTVQLHGPTDPAVWTHSDAQRHIGLKSNCECLGKNECRYGLPAKCLSEVSPDSVLAACIKLLK